MEQTIMSRQTMSVVTVTIEDREGEGLRVYSDNLPGLILSGADKAKVCSWIAPAIQALFEHGGHTVTVHATKQPNIRNKLARGKFTAAFMFQCLEAVGTTSVRLKDD
jgi:hypothetical protein